MFLDRERIRRVARALPLAAMLAAPAVATQVPFVRAAVVSLATTMHAGGPEGVALYTLAFCVGAVLAIPLWIFGGLAGFAWGPVRGALTSVPAATLAATLAFFVGRRLATTATGRRWLDHPRLRMVSAVVRADGLRIVIMLRLTPMVPQSLLHYALAATPLRARDFVLSTALGLAPHLIFQSYVGSLVHDAAELFARDRASLRDPHTWVTPAAGLALTALLVGLVTRAARKALAAATAPVTTDRSHTGASAPPDA